MGYLRNLPKHKAPPLLANIGNSVKAALEIGAAAKGLYDTGMHIYQGAGLIGPLLATGVQYIGPTFLQLPLYF